MKRPRDYQVEAVASAVGLAEDGTPSVIAAPVGSGKSLMAAMIARHYASRYKRCLILAHRRELIAQNANECAEFGLNCGVISNGLGQHQAGHLVTAASVQTLANREIPPVDAIIIDECHRMPWRNAKNSQYAKVLARHPGAALIGLSGTPYRTSGGDIYGVEHWRYFRELAYSISMLDLMRGGYLCRPSSRVETELVDDSALVKSRSTGDYTGASMAAARRGDILASTDEAVDLMAGRRSIIVFASGIEEADKIGDHLGLRGEEAVVVHSAMESDRDESVAAFKAGRARWLITRDIALEGFNHPATDGLVWFRPTDSKIVWVQGNGRGLRCAEGKTDCLILDYSGNIRRNGAIDSEQHQYAPRRCRGCEKLNPPSARTCLYCGVELIKVSAASTIEALPEKRKSYSLDKGGGILSDEGSDWIDIGAIFVTMPRRSEKKLVIAKYYPPGGDEITIFLSPFSDLSWLAKKSLAHLSRLYGDGIVETIGLGINSLQGHINRAAPRCPRRIRAARKNGYWNLLEEDYGP